MAPEDTVTPSDFSSSVTSKADQGGISVPACPTLSVDVILYNSCDSKPFEGSIVQRDLTIRAMGALKATIRIAELDCVSRLHW